MKELVNKTEFMNSLTEEELHSGYIKFNIPNDGSGHRFASEGIWGWVTPENKKKYNDDTCFEKITAILCNDPLNFANRLKLFDEVVIQCMGKERPVLDNDFIHEYLL